MNRIDSQIAPRALESFSLARFEGFYEVARLGSVASAARALGRSQPAISHRLRALQDELGVVLFEKVGRRLQLTEAGQRLRDRCADFFAWSRSLHAAVSDAAAPEGRVTIGTLPTVASHLVVDTVAGLLERYPNLELAFVFDTVPALLTSLREGRADVLVLVGDVAADGLDVETIATSEFAAVMCSRVAPRRRGRISISELRARRYLAWDGPPDPTFDVVRRYIARRRLSSAYSPRVPNIETLRALAAAGCGYAILPLYTVERDVTGGRLVALAPAGLRDQVPIHLVGRARQLVGPGLRVVRDAFTARPLETARSPRRR